MLEACWRCRAGHLGYHTPSLQQRSTAVGNGGLLTPLGAAAATPGSGSLSGKAAVAAVAGLTPPSVGGLGTAPALSGVLGSARRVAQPVTATAL